MHYCVYILSCSNNTYYTGYTSDLGRRYQEHIQGTDKCKYTRSFKPTAIAQAWEIQGTKASAMKIERYIKTLRKAEKEQLILHPQQLINVFPDELLDIFN
ncbi:hypothetical protein BH10PSE19_BH10PSE19_04290 [soil metagenome]